MWPHWAPRQRGHCLVQESLTLSPFQTGFHLHRLLLVLLTRALRGAFGSACVCFSAGSGGGELRPPPPSHPGSPGRGEGGGSLTGMGAGVERENRE